LSSATLAAISARKSSVGGAAPPEFAGPEFAAPELPPAAPPELAASEAPFAPDITRDPKTKTPTPVAWAGFGNKKTPPPVAWAGFGLRLSVQMFGYTQLPV
jgi:hypothetical protein